MNSFFQNKPPFLTYIQPPEKGLEVFHTFVNDPESQNDSVIIKVTGEGGGCNKVSECRTDCRSSLAFREKEPTAVMAPGSTRTVIVA